MQNAQVSIEAIILITVLLFVLLGAVLLITQKTLMGKPAIDNSKNFAECHKIANTISLIQSAEAITEQTMVIENSIKIVKNNIIIGETGCYYFGSVEGDTMEMPFSNGATIKIWKDAGGKTHVTSP